MCPECLLTYANPYHSKTRKSKIRSQTALLSQLIVHFHAKLRKMDQRVSWRPLRAGFPQECRTTKGTGNIPDPLFRGRSDRCGRFFRCYCPILPRSYFATKASMYAPGVNVSSYDPSTPGRSVDCVSPAMQTVVKPSSTGPTQSCSPLLPPNSVEAASCLSGFFDVSRRVRKISLPPFSVLPSVVGKSVEPATPLTTISPDLSM